MLYTPESWRDLPRVVHKGWAPCAHEPAGKAVLMAGDYFLPGATIEDLIYNINMIAPGVYCVVDQWWGVTAEAALWSEGRQALVFYTSIQGDSLVLALTETYKVWKAKYEEITQEPVEEFAHLGVSFD